MAISRKKTGKMKAKTTKSKSRKTGVLASKKRFSLSFKQQVAVLVVAVVAVAGIGYFGYNGIRNYQARATVFQYVGQHPQAATETTDKAKVITALAGWNGKVYAGYGDWDRNTGPVSLTPFDTKVGQFTSTPEYVAGTEAIEDFKIVGNRLFALHVDPQGGSDNAYSVADASSGATVWSRVAPGQLPITHVYGMAVGSNDNELFLAAQRDEGSASNEVAKVYRSTDGGATWSESLSVPSRGGYNRMSFIGNYNGNIYVQRMSMTDFKGNGAESQAWVWNGSRWSSASTINAYMPRKAEQFAGKLVMKNGSGNYLLAYDGRKTSTVRGSVNDYVIAPDGYLYALGYSYEDGASTQVVVRTKDLSSWENVTYSPGSGASITYLNKHLYIGTYDSKLYRAEINPNIVDATPPTVSLVLPTNNATMNSTKNELAARANDASGIKKIEFYVDDYLAGSALSLPAHSGLSTYMDAYTTYWDGSGVAAGQHQLVAIAYDVFGNAKTSTPITITVPESVAQVDTKAPVVTITAPTDSSRNIRKSFTFRANAVDESRLASIELILDGKTVQTVTATSAYTTTLQINNAQSLSRGSHTVVVIARDGSGNVGQASYSFKSK